MAPILWLINTLAPSWWILYPKVLELSLRSVGFFMSLCPYAYLELSLSGSSIASDPGSLTTTVELFNISTLDPLLPTLLIATLCLCVLLTILYYSLAIAWEVFWATRRSPSPLDSSTEVVLTGNWSAKPKGQTIYWGYRFLTVHHEWPDQSHRKWRNRKGFSVH